MSLDKPFFLSGSMTANQIPSAAPYRKGRVWLAPPAPGEWLWWAEFQLKRVQNWWRKKAGRCVDATRGSQRLPVSCDSRTVAEVPPTSSFQSEANETGPVSKMSQPDLKGLESQWCRNTSANFWELHSFKLIPALSLPNDSSVPFIFINWEFCL